MPMLIFNQAAQVTMLDLHVSNICTSITSLLLQLQTDSDALQRHGYQSVG